MPTNKDYLKQDNSKDFKLEVYIEKQRLMFICGMVMFAILEALETGELAKLKLLISQFCYEDSSELAQMRLNDFAEPFKGLAAHNIVRFPDEIWENTLIDESVDYVDFDCPCEVSFYNGQINVRWTLPRIEYVWQCSNANKLAYTAMVIMEELFHIRQMITPNTRAITTLGAMLELDAVQNTSEMEPADRELLQQLSETDVTFFFNTYFKKFVDQIQWFTSRAGAKDYHKTMAPQEFIEAIMHLSNKYGYAEEVAETLFADIVSFIEMNPDLGIPMLMADGLKVFIDKAAS